MGSQSGTFTPDASVRDYIERNFQLPFQPVLADGGGVGKADSLPAQKGDILLSGAIAPAAEQTGTECVDGSGRPPGTPSVNGGGAYGRNSSESAGRYPISSTHGEIGACPRILGDGRLSQ